MKYVLLILDGATDAPRPELEGRTPLMVARMPHLREMVRQGNIGVARPLPAEAAIDPEAALLACFGYYPPDWWTGRGPLEAAALDIPLDRRDVAFRANLIHTDGERLLDPTAGRITDRWARPLVEHLAERLRGRFLQLYPGHGYRHVLVWHDGPTDLGCTNPREIAGEPLAVHYPVGDRAERLRRLMEDSYEILSAHPLNRQREDRGLPPATMIWPWGGGLPTRLPPFGFRHGLGGALIAGHPLARGIGRLAGLAVPDLPEATGTRDTDYTVKAKAALAMLPSHDFVAVHIYAPHDAAQDGDWEAKRSEERRVGKECRSRWSPYH